MYLPLTVTGDVPSCPNLRPGDEVVIARRGDDLILSVVLTPAITQAILAGLASGNLTGPDGIPAADLLVDLAAILGPSLGAVA